MKVAMAEENTEVSIWGDAFAFIDTAARDDACCRLLSALGCALGAKALAPLAQRSANVTAAWRMRWAK